MVPVIPLTAAELGQRGAARLQPGFPQQVPRGHLVLHGPQRAPVALHSPCHHGQDGAEGWLRGGSQRCALGRVSGEVEEQGWVVVSHVIRCAEAGVRVEAGRLVLGVEIGREVERFPHGAT